MLDTPAVMHSHFGTQTVLPKDRFSAWRELVGGMVDISPTQLKLETPFAASIDRWQVGDTVFYDCWSDSLTVDRSLTRISRDNVRGIFFQVFLEGVVSEIKVRSSQRKSEPAVATMFALDMDQPSQMRRTTTRDLTLYVPHELVAEAFPDPPALHGRTVDGTAPQARLVIEYLMALRQDIGHMSAPEMHNAMRNGTQLMIAALSKQARFSGDARAAVRAVMFDRVRRFVKEHLHDATLSPESIVGALQLPRRNIYRLFEHEGGLNAYIRKQRLRAAADDLLNYPHLKVLEIAYGLGFSASDFTRAFRRAYDMSPQDFRMQSMVSGGRPPSSDSLSWPPVPF